MSLFHHIALIGDMYTGKSSFVKSLLGIYNRNDYYVDNKEMQLTEIKLDDINSSYTSYLRDIPSSKSVMAHHYIKNADCVLIFCDNNVETLLNAFEWSKDVDTLCCLVITKKDLERDDYFDELLDQNANMFASIYEISLKESHLNEMSLTDILLEINKQIENQKQFI